MQRTYLKDEVNMQRTYLMLVLLSYGAGSHAYVHSGLTVLGPSCRCLCNSIDRYILLKRGAYMTNMVRLSNSQLGHAAATTRRQDILNPCFDLKFFIHVNEADVSESLQASAPVISRACKAPQISISGSRTPQRQRMVMRRFQGAPSLDKQRFLQEWSQVLPMLLTSKR
jgi:hypothetical protein